MKRILALLLLPSLLIADPAEPPIREGVLNAKSRTLDGGIPYETYQVRFQVGEEVTLNLRSDDFDTFLMVITPDGFFREDDDGGGDTNSRISFVVESEELHTIVVRAFSAEESGSYQLSWGQRQGVQRLDAAERAGRVAGIVPGNVGDAQGNAGFRIALREGESLQAEVRSSAFDTHILVMGPDGTLWLNDDWQGSTEHSRVDVKAAAAGDYLILVSEYGGGSGGAFTFEWKVEE